MPFWDKFRVWRVVFTLRASDSWYTPWSQRIFPDMSTKVRNLFSNSNSFINLAPLGPMAFLCIGSEFPRLSEIIVLLYLSACNKNLAPKCVIWFWETSRWTISEFWGPSGFSRNSSVAISDSVKWFVLSKKFAICLIPSSPSLFLLSLNWEISGFTINIFLSSNAVLGPSRRSLKIILRLIHLSLQFSLNLLNWSWFRLE